MPVAGGYTWYKGDEFKNFIKVTMSLNAFQNRIMLKGRQAMCTKF